MAYTARKKIVMAKTNTIAGKNSNDAQNDTNDAPKKKSSYETMILGVSASRKPTRNKLDDLAASLGCKASDLVWSAIKEMLTKPPKVAPEGSSGAVGTAPGFWVVPTTNKQGKATGIRVWEVEKRSEKIGKDGRIFFRFKKGDVKGRDRAQRSAIRAAANDAKLLGLKADGMKSEKYSEDAEA